LPTDLSALGRKPAARELMGIMHSDKKTEGGKVKFVLPKKIGEAVVTKEWDESLLNGLLER
jgi:3-dehydroquinate synthetase